MRYVEVEEVVANVQIILGHTVAAACILLRTTRGVSAVVVPNFHAVMFESNVFGRDVRDHVVVVDESPVIRKHKIREIGEPVCQ